MEWLVVAMIGLVIGTLFSFYAQSSARMPQALCITLALIGAIAGASLERITGIQLFGRWTFYLAGAIVSIGFLAGGLLSYTLTGSEKRV